MCGRFAQYTGLEAIQDAFGIDVVTCGQEPDYNTAPSQEILAMIEHEGKRRLGLLEWGLLPFWAKDPSEARRPINARSETAHQKPTFRQPFRSRRCLIPADGFYEWQKTSDGSKQPFFIQLPSKAPFAFAGLWDIWKGTTPNPSPPGSEHLGPEKQVRSCAILTTASVGPIRKIHDRMPVILTPEAYDGWLDPDFQETNGVRKMLQESMIRDFVAHPVSRRVNFAKNKGADLIRPVSTELPDPFEKEPTT